MSDSGESQISVDERHIEAIFEIDPHVCCPLANVQTDVSRVLVDREGDTCRCDLVVSVQVDDEVGTMVAQVSSEVDRCAGTVFDEYGCVPEVLEVSESRLRVRTFLDETVDIDGLLADLKEVCGTVKLVKVTSNFDASVRKIVKDVDLTDFTAKQKETMERAIKEGYYTRPREVSLEELAEEFGVSEQALAQRLARVEQKIMEQLIQREA